MHSVEGLLPLIQRSISKYECGVQERTLYSGCYMVAGHISYQKNGESDINLIIYIIFPIVLH